MFAKTITTEDAPAFADFRRLGRGAA